jgi:hypothetical protein
MRTLLAVLLLTLSACPAPTDGEAKPAPPAAKASPAKAPEASAPKFDAGAIAKAITASAAYHRDAPAGRVPFPPGSGSLVEVPQADRAAMVAAASTFLLATKDDDTETMRLVSTSHLASHLIDNLHKYRDRFMKGMAGPLASVDGGVGGGEVRSPADGHFEIELKFSDGTARRVMVAVESYQWRVNRL